MHRSLLVLFCFLTTASSAQAAPRITWMFPSGGERGATVRVQVGGTQLNGLTGFFSTGQGLSARVLPPQPGEDPRTERTLEITISADAALGGREARVYDATGASNPKVFAVGQFLELPEAEPNDVRSEAQKLELPVTVNGRVGRGSDVDGFRFTLKKGQQAWAEIESQRLLANLGDSWLKGYAWVEDSRGNLLAESNGYYRWDPYVQFVAPEDGEYTVSYRDVQYRGAPTGVYRLTVSTGAHLYGVFPMGGQRGTATPVQLVGANAERDPGLSVILPADAPEEWIQQIFNVSGVWTNAIPFAVSRFPNSLEREPNNDRASATQVEFPSELQGVLAAAGDVDWFVFRGKKGDRLVAEVLSRGVGLPLDSLLTLRNAEGSLLTENDDGQDRNQDDNRDRDSRLQRTLDADGDYYLQIRDVDGRGGPDFLYRLSLRPPLPNFRLQAQSDKPLVKAGSSVTLDLTVTRSDGFDGEVTVTVDGLPTGLSASPLTIARGQSSGKLTVQCAAGTAHQPVLLRVWGEATVDGVKERRLAKTLEIYNTQGTAYRRELTGPVLVVVD